MPSTASSAAAPVRIDIGSRSGRYPIHIAPAVSARAVVAARRESAFRNDGSIVSNSVVWRFHAESFAGLTPDDPILIADGERFKNLQTVGRIYDALIRAQRGSIQRAHRHRRRHRR